MAHTIHAYIWWAKKEGVGMIWVNSLDGRKSLKLNHHVCCVCVCGCVYYYYYYLHLRDKLYRYKNLDSSFYFINLSINAVSSSVFNSHKLITLSMEQKWIILLESNCFSSIKQWVAHNYLHLYIILIVSLDIFDIQHLIFIYVVLIRFL